jgi:PIN domain nuclease of toxin-antitoxin system
VIIVDTHAWIWWASAPDKLSRKAQAAIDGDERIGVCAISCWEVAMLVTKGRLQLDRPASRWVRQALELPRVELIPLSPEISIAAAELEAVHGDPADRMILASALSHRCPLVTRDERLRSAKVVQTVW